MRQSSPGAPIVTFDTPMSYIIVDAYYYLDQSRRTGEQTITPGNSFDGSIDDGVYLSISLSENGLTVSAIITNSQMQTKIFFNIKGYGRRQ